MVLPVFRESAEPGPFYYQLTALQGAGPVVVGFVEDPYLNPETVTPARSPGNLPVRVGEPPLMAYEVRPEEVRYFRATEFLGVVSDLATSINVAEHPFAVLELAQSLQDEGLEAQAAAECFRSLANVSRPLATAWSRSLNAGIAEAAGALEPDSDNEDDVEIEQRGSIRPKFAFRRRRSRYASDPCFAVFGDAVIAGTLTGSVHAWDARSGTKLARMRGDGNEMDCLAVSPKGDRVATASQGYVSIWDWPSGRFVVQMKRTRTSVNKLYFSADDRYLFSASLYGRSEVWDAESGDYLHRIAEPSRWSGSAVAAVPGHPWAFVVGQSAILWDLRTAAAKWTEPAHAGTVWQVVVDRIGRNALSVGSDRNMILWDLRRGGRTDILAGHRFSVIGAAITDDGRFGVSASHDRSMAFWDLRKGRLIHRIERASVRLRALATVPGMHVCAAPIDDRAVGLWDLPSGRLLTTLQTGRFGVDALAVTAEARHVVGVARERILVWPLGSHALS